MAEARGRKPGFAMSEEHRVKIRNSNILNALIEHVEGSREMAPSQVSAGLGLLKKVLPDVQSVEISGPDGEAIEIKDASPMDSARRIAFILAAAEQAKKDT